ncbi:MAG: glucose-6-phosphate dehydrogenase [Planctomycetes bacterium]|nr:glucose-6-phosphate dehydrogenase [Planctomycetota bacterium]
MPPLTIIIFGASGDLTSRKLIPALFHLDMAGLLPDDANIVGVARRPFSNDAFRSSVEPMTREAMLSMGESWFPGAWNRFAKRLFYVAGDATTTEGLQHLTEFLQKREGTTGGQRLYYLSVSPDLYPQIAARFGEAGYEKEIGGFRRVVIEKPFGHNLETGRAVNKSLHACFREDQIYRIDHYLGKETVQNILIFRFANTMFEPLWNHQYIDHVQITAAEKVPVGKRGGYYNDSGVLRDMFQSHLLQVVTMVAMENPGRYTADRLRNEKIKVLEAMKISKVEDAFNNIAVGQYDGYRNEEGVPKDSKTPTYAAIRLEIDNGRWSNVPFYVRSGKSMRSRYSEVSIQFRCPPHMLIPMPPGETLECNHLSLILQPNEGIRLNFQTKVPEVDGTRLQARDLAFDYRDAFTERALPEAYERLLLDAIMGEATLFMRNDEIEQAWEIMDPLIAATEAANAPQPEVYAPGSDGPKCADALLAKEGRKWQKIR